MRISDWSSDVCSSDLRSTRRAGRSRFEACDEIERAGSFQGEQIRIVRVVSAWPGMTARRAGDNDAGRRLRMRGDPLPDRGRTLRPRLGPLDRKSVEEGKSV